MVYTVYNAKGDSTVTAPKEEVFKLIAKLAKGTKFSITETYPDKTYERHYIR